MVKRWRSAFTVYSRRTHHSPSTHRLFSSILPILLCTKGEEAKGRGRLGPSGTCLNVIIGVRPKTEKNPEKPNVALSPDRLRAAEADQLHLLDIYLGSEADFSAIFSGSLMPKP